MKGEAICPYCKMVVRLKKSGHMHEHRVNGIYCQGGGTRP